MKQHYHPGTVIRQHLGHHIVAADDGRVVDCALSSRLRKQLDYPEADPGSRRQRVQAVRRARVTDPVAIGDRVVFEDGGDNQGMIREIQPRRNKISRRAAGGGNKEQILAANIDQVMPIFSAAQPDPEWHLLDRMLAIAEWQQIPPAICLNKMDLTTPGDACTAMRSYEGMGYRVLYTSTKTGTGKEALRSLLKGRTTLLMGPSGVGKSSLVNWMQPGLNLRTGEISPASGEGRHITTHTELVALEGGGMVGDIPGVREFQLWNVQPQDIPDLFREFRPYLNQCRFRDCAHGREPGCAIKSALEAREISPTRYESYLRLREKP